VRANPILTGEAKAAQPASQELVDEIILDGRRVKVRGVDLPLQDVKLDPANPRVANTAAVSHLGRAEELQRELENLLWSDPDVHDLYHAVLKNKGLVERIIVRSDGTVAEGNCRTVVYRRLAAAFKNDEAWQRIPARILPEDISERHVAILLGELHVGGKNKWSAFEKAGHIYKLSTEFGYSQDEVAKLLRMSKTAVNHNIRAFSAMKEHYMLRFPGPGSPRKFSHFFELFRSPELRDWVAREDNALAQFVEWVGQEKVPNGANVRDLPDIIRNEDALTALRKSGLDAAKRVLELDRPELTSELFRKMVEMKDALGDARLDDIQRVRKDRVGSAKRIVRDLRESLDRFIELCDGI
jgi:hypothetical protein